MTLRTLGFCLLVLAPAAALAASHHSSARAPSAPAPAAPEPSASATAAKPATAPAAAPTAAPGPPPTTWDSYRVLSERNIFMRYRSRPSGGRPSSAPSVRAPVATAEDYLVLTGIIQQGENCVAFIEDTRTGKTAQLQAGDPLGRGRLTQITRDLVQYACDGNFRQISIGANLAGAPVAFPKSATTTTSAATSTGSSRAAPSGPPGAAPAAPPPAAVPTAPGAAPVTMPGAPAAVAGTLPAQPPTAPSPAAAGISDDTKNAGSASVELQMRLRREQELNK